MSLLLTFSEPRGAAARYVIAGNRNRVPTGFALSGSPNVMKYDGIDHVAPKGTGLTAVRAFVENRYAQANGPYSSTGLVAFKSQVSLEYPIGGTLYPLLFSGADELLLNPGDGVWTDWSAPVAIPAGAHFRIRTDREHVGTGGANYNQLSNVLLSGNGATNIGKIDHGSSGTDTTLHKSRGGSYPAASGVTSSHTATLVQGKPAVAGTGQVLIVSDSIGRGSGDTSGTTRQGDYLNGTSPAAPYVNLGNVGWVETSIGDALPYFSMAVPSKQVINSSFNEANLGPQFDLLALSKPTQVVLALGVNDLMQGRTPAQVLADLISATAILLARFPGVEVYPATITPVTNTTDAYATTANQTFTGTPPAGGTVTWSNFNGTDDTTGRRLLNAWIRAGLVTGAAGYLDPALSCQDATDPRKWRVDLGQPTADGVHPQFVLHRRMAADADLGVVLATVGAFNNGFSQGFF